MTSFRRQSVAAVVKVVVFLACLSLYSLYQLGMFRGHAVAQRQPLHAALTTASSPLSEEARNVPFTRDCDRLEQITRRTVRNPVVLSDQEAAEIKLLISGLSTIADKETSVHFDMYDREFRPLAMNDGLFHPSNPIFTSEFEPNQRLDQSPVMNRLVELGPRALSLLLAALDDPTPTKVVVIRRGFCSLTLDSHIWVNPRNPFELNALERSPGSLSTRIDQHTVTVGDLCFVAIGQIVGREYHIFTDVPQAEVEVRSTTRDARLCQQVRSIWSSSEPAQKLLTSLLCDLRMPPNDKIQDRNTYQLPSKAATRLLYYFPREAVDLIIDRLEHLDVTSPKSGHWAGEFVKAVSWCHEPRLQAALLRILDREPRTMIISPVHSRTSLGDLNLTGPEGLVLPAICSKHYDVPQG